MEDQTQQQIENMKQLLELDKVAMGEDRQTIKILNLNIENAQNQIATLTEQLEEANKKLQNGQKKQGK